MFGPRDQRLLKISKPGNKARFEYHVIYRREYFMARGGMKVTTGMTFEER